jgi:argininosuccinate lyase
MKKLWEKDKTPLSDAIEAFTVGQDRIWDIQLAPFDVLGSIAHVRMLAETGLLGREDAALLVRGLQQIAEEIQAGTFSLEEGVEDVHSQVELLLTRRLGDVGKKIHSARSRNDQVLVDIRLFLRSELEKTVLAAGDLFSLLLRQAERFQSRLLPGYTHLQLAMPSSFGLWFGAYAESLVDDLAVLRAAFDVVDQNPLGSAAGFGSSFPINRRLTTELLGFSDLSYNVVYAQMGRGKSERICAMALANLADTLARLSMDACLYLNQNFDFIRFPDSLTTGSSIMPHKKNPDVFELIRARCNRIKALPNEILMVTTNLPSGYHRDLQILKEHVFPAFGELQDCFRMAVLMLSQVEVRENLLEDAKYKQLFTVEAVNRKVLGGMAFRDAYREVGEEVMDGSFEPESTTLHHTHEGSIGNLCLEAIEQKMKRTLASFPFERVRASLSSLLNRV